MRLKGVCMKNMNEVLKTRKLVRLVNGVPKYEYSGILRISSRPFEKENKIYEQHYDHSYAKNIIIDCVNDDCLAQIFTHVPICERPKLTLVCKKWKRALDDSWFNVKKIELTHRRPDEFPNDLTKYLTIDGGYSVLESVLSKCGRFLTTLDLTAYGHYNIVPVINDSCPKLVKLCLRITYINNRNLCDTFTRLSKLKILLIIFQMKALPLAPIVALMNSLKNVANTLTHLSLTNWVHDVRGCLDFTKLLNDVLRDLKALKSLEVAGLEILHNSFDYFQSDPLMNITSLIMMGCRTTNETLYTIANTFKHLEVLHIKSEWVTDDGVVAISKMNNLQTLKFFGSHNITDSSVKLLEYMINLQLPCSTKITDDSVMKVLENSPKMDELDVSGTNVTAELVKKAAEISRNRKQHLIFRVSFIPDIQQYESPYFEIHLPVI
ncbi:F-box/LRR-repeat protein 12-like [Aphidius gifuensis]|uniref:F-box/LRR-repeat protein 12-like n=1 Tax=Aphidius gifuensis TaxID=684658 RepID=UPI001CDB694C|nr:F-box/LRR-repeat protein 12-like [Aphidius gifuensis]